MQRFKTLRVGITAVSVVEQQSTSKIKMPEVAYDVASAPLSFENDVKATVAHANTYDFTPRQLRYPSLNIFFVHVWYLSVVAIVPFRFLRPARIMTFRLS